MAKKTRSLSALRLWYIGAVLVVLAGLGVGLFIHYHNKKVVTVSTSSSTRPPNNINYTPIPSSNDQNNARKGSNTSQPLNSSTNSTNPPAFSVTISRASASGKNITVAANVNGASSGSCVFNFSTKSGGSSVVSSSPEQIQTTNQSAECPPVTVTMPSSGTWYVSVSVNSQGSTTTAEWLGQPPVTS